ncbi:MAG: hypothetical protein C5B50_22825 [Verrucomicrobia bacterium]|nr:MAG: hypothetical protein C5B50_22825 [Verrucomicrobiota bacterium]
MLGFYPQQYSGQVHLFRSPGHPLFCSYAEDYGWGSYCTKGAEITILPAGHERILEEPCVKLLAEELNEALDQASGRSQRSASTCQIGPTGLAGLAKGAAKEETLSQLFQAQAFRTPNAEALVCGNTRLTYHELYARSTLIAERLRALGVGDQTLVGICLERSWEMVSGILGALLAGGAYVPMDPAYPADRLAFMLEDSGASVVLTQRKLRSRLEGFRVQGSGREVKVICVEDALEGVRPAAATRTTQHAVQNPKSEIRNPKSSDLAYIIYTSGSTGRPKGVALEHRSAVALMDWVKEAFTAQELAGVLASTSICFDLSVFELFAPLSWGGRVILAENALALGNLPAAREVTLINTVPSAMRELLRLKAVPETVKVIALAGEPLSGALVDQIYAQTQVEKVYDLYGPTETTTYSTWALRRAGEKPTIGRPLPGEQVYLLDEHMKPVPAGAAGEICIGGVGLARGYLNRPELTAEKFVQNPFKQSRDREGASSGGIPGSAGISVRENSGGETRAQDARAPRQRLYRTGDLGRWREDGQLEYVGRLDNQVKLRGYRIELGEIEAVLREHPAVGEAVVVARGFQITSDRSDRSDRSDESADKRLVAYLVARAGAELSESELRQWVIKKLPAYMEPAYFVELESFPLTPNGKIDRKALPAPPERSAGGREIVPPRSPAEEKLAAIWREVLGIAQVGINESFFALGGHSLLAVQIISRVREAFGAELPLSSLFDAPTIEALAQSLSSGRWNSLGSALSLERAPRDRPLPASFVQKRLWILHQLAPNSPAYHVPVALRLKGSLQIQSLEDALNDVVRRHEALRTTFRYEEPDLIQVVADEVFVEIAVPRNFVNPVSPVGLVRQNGYDQAAIGDWISREVGRPFDLSQGPLLRANMLRLSEHDHILLVVFHHTVCDGWSLATFFEELGQFYKTHTSKGGVVPKIADLQFQYPDFAVWERNRLQGEVLAEAMGYWKEQLSGAPPAIDLPADRPSQTQPSNRAAQHSQVLGPELAAGVLEISRRENLTPFIVLLTALDITLQKWTGQQDLVVGTVVAGRTRREFESVIGCFMNFLPIRAKIAGTETGAEMLARVRAAVLKAQAHQDCPFDKIVEAVNPPRHPNRNPIYNVGLLLQNFPNEIFRAENLQVSRIKVPVQDALLDLRFEAEGVEGDFSICCEYKSDLFEARTIEQLLACLGQVLETLVRRPQTPLSDFPVVLTSNCTTKQATAVSVKRESFSAQESSAGFQPAVSPISNRQTALNFPAADLSLPAQAGSTATQQVGNLRYEVVPGTEPVSAKSQQTIAVAATFTAEPVADALRYWLQKLQLPAQIEFAPFNQVFQQLLDPCSLLSSNKSGLNLIFVRIQDWSEPETDANEFLRALKAAAIRSSAPYVVCFCPGKPNSEGARPAPELEKVESALASELAEVGGVSVITTKDVERWYSVHEYYDPEGDELAHLPYTPVFFTALATAVARRFHSLQRSAYKVIALDCDQTLWSGVCGEDGPKGVRMDEARQALQEFMREQHAAGMLLCLCSKNNEADVFEVFGHRLDMPLRREHLAACKINWRPKSENLKALAQELGLGLDSFIFLDDDPLECAELEANCPEVLTLQLPEKLEQIPQFLNHCWAFDHIRTTSEDRRRSDLYRENQAREAMRLETPTLAGFLASLELRIQIEPMSSAQVPRVAQLTQRTNQFNCTTRRLAESDVERFLPSKTAVLNSGEAFTVQVSDRFGDYGLVGVILFETQGDALDVSTFLLSCRALGRGVEYQMLARMGSLALERKLRWVDVHFVPSSRNQPALDFLRTVGAAYQQPRNGGSVFRFPAEVAAETRFQPDKAGTQPTGSAGVSSASNSAVPKNRPDLASPIADSAQQTQRTPFREIALLSLDPARIHHGVESAFNRQSPREARHEPPRTKTQALLCDLWSQVLHLETVGVNDNFFELGGNSLAAVQLASRIRRAFKVEMLLEGLFDAQTISALASNLDAGKWPRSERDLAHPTPVPRTGPMPLSFAQERLWFLDQLEPRSALYNVPIATRISGSLDLSVLQRSLQAIIDRHESLRTRFVWNGDGPAQIVDSAVALDVRPLDLVTSKGEPQHLHQLPGSEREGQWSVVSGQWSPAVQRVVHDEVNRPFDLTAGPLVRALLLRIGPSEHLLVLTLHHIVADEWSLKLLFEELASFYASFARGEQPTLDPLSIQYADYAVWQRQSLQGERLEQLLNFWKQQLAGSPPVTHCPTDHPRAVSPTFRGRVEELTLSPRLSAELKQLGNAQDATLYMVLLAAFKALLFRYSRQTDLIISSPVAGRASRETEDLIGFFVNTVLLRTDLSGNPEFRQLLRRVRTVALAVFAHQDLPFEKLVEALQPERSTDHNPFTKIMFGVESSGLERMQLPGADVQFHEVATDTAKFDITLIAQDRSSGLNLRAEYNTDLFEPATITRLLQHFEVLLRGIVAWPDKRISELPLLPAAERQRVLVDWNSVRADFPTDECLNQLFEAQAERSPRATAVVCGEESINYRDLDERAARLAQHLVQCGIGPDVPVGICLERSIQMVVGLLGVLKAGGAYVPMDPAYPADRLAFILEDSGAPVLLTQRKLKTKAEELRVQGSGRKLNAICLEEVFEDSQSADATRNTQHASRNPKSEIRTPKSSNLAYIIYTSGSTGRPKGVLLEHRSAVALMHWAKEAFTAEELSGVLASTSICFDLSVFELFAPLSWGGRVILAENALALSSLPAARDVSLINTVPSAMRELLRLKAVPETVKVIALAGEPLSEALVDQIYAQTKVEKVYDLYGPTETTVYSTWALRRAGEQPTIGRPLPGEQVYVLDEQMQPMPLGVAGEIYIGGVGQARGYLNRPDLTSERFVNSPFQQSRDREGAPGGSLPGSASPARENDGGETRGQDARAPRARLYRTGDLGRWRPDGQLEYLGRLDNQVKVRGFRIELGEIEVVLRQHPAVGEAVVVARNFGVGSDRSDRSDEALEKRLVAYVIPRTEEELSENELRRWVAKKLPPYMEPAHFVQLEKLPLTPNGKVDRKALPAPQEKQTLGSSSPQRPPGNETEKLLAGVWCRILGRESVGINENFFHVGGHSLLAVRLLAEVEKTAGKKLPLVSLFQGPTIEQMAKALSAEGDRPSGSLVVPIRSGGKRAPLFLVHGAGGEVFWGYANLAAHLNSEQPIYGIKSRGQAGLPEFTTIEQMAACYIQEIRRVQPSGPYHLGGYCLGGNIAYEMARQLRAAGQPVGAVLLLDSAPANAGYDILAWWKPLFGLRFAANFWLWLKDFEQLSRQDRLRLIARKSKAFWRKLRGKVGPASRLPSPWHSAPVENRAAPLDLEEVVDPTYFTEQELNLWRVHLQARATHTDKAYHGQVILLRTKGQPLFCSLDPDFCWSKVAKGGVIVKRIPGSHENIFLEPNVRFLAREIEACLSGCNGEANEVLTTDKHG